MRKSNEQDVGSKPTMPHSESCQKVFGFTEKEIESHESSLSKCSKFGRKLRRDAL